MGLGIFGVGLVLLIIILLAENVKNYLMTTYQTSTRINYGKQILPIKMVELFSADDWEIFIEEWIDLKKSIYVTVDRFGGAGDKGRDVVGYITDNKNPNYVWDCYQCKHYDNALLPTQVYVEFAKIIYYSFLKEYPVPKSYHFIAPKGCGTALSKLLSSPVSLRDKLIDNWDKYCKDFITSTPIELKDDLLKYFMDFDFSIFSKIAIKDIIAEHSKHPNHLLWFGGGLPDRPRLDEDTIPVDVQISETVYVNELLAAYGSETSTVYKFPSDLAGIDKYINHFSRTRINFHYAEQLRNFSRDSLPVGTYDDFQKEIYDGIVDKIEDDHENGFIKVKEVESEARKIIIASNPLREVSLINDRTGICHQLVNDGKFKWLKK